MTSSGSTSTFRVNPPTSPTDIILSLQYSSPYPMRVAFVATVNSFYLTTPISDIAPGLFTQRFNNTMLFYCIPPATTHEYPGFHPSSGIDFCVIKTLSMFRIGAKLIRTTSGYCKRSQIGLQNVHRGSLEYSLSLTCARITALRNR